MPLNKFQYEALFTNAFAAPPAAQGVSIDDSGDVAIGKAGAHTVELLVIQERPLEWRVDGVTLIAWKSVLRPDDPKRQQNAEALRAKLV
jgi:hypothetical protein